MNLIDALSISTARIEAAIAIQHGRAAKQGRVHRGPGPRISGQAIGRRAEALPSPAGAATLGAMRCSRAVLVRTLDMLGQAGG